MRRLTNLRLPMLGAMLVVALSLVAGAFPALAYAVEHATIAIRSMEISAIRDGSLAVVGALGAAFLVCSLIAALRHAKHEMLAASAAA